MGKESKLRTRYKDGETRQQYSNGDRKFYEKNACPAGADEYVWSLAIYFELRLEKMGVTGESKLPITYTELYEKISHDKDLTSLVNPGTIHTIDTKGEGGPPRIGGNRKTLYRSTYFKDKDIYDFIVRCIDYYYDNYNSNSIPSIGNFTSSLYVIKLLLIDNDYLKTLKTSGTKRPVLQREPLADRRSENTREVLDITVNHVYTEQEIEEAFTRFREGNNK